MDDVPNIDLYNFENEEFRNCRYVITSPRSLEACSRLKIEPIELLPQSMEEFAKRFHNYPAKKLEQLFSYYENRRKAKLARVRYERSILLADQSVTTDETNTEQPYKVSVVEGPEDKSLLDALPPKYAGLIQKLTPGDAKRLKLAHQRCQELADGLFGPKGGDLIVYGHTPRPCSSLVRSTLSVESSRSNAAIPPCCTQRSCSTSSHSKERRVSSKRSMENYERAKEVEQRLELARERKQKLENLLETYRNQLQDTLEQTQQRVKERASTRLLEEQQRRSVERQSREDIVRQNTKELEERQQLARRLMEKSKRKKEAHVQRMIEEREARAQESRNLARAAEDLRQEMLRVYKLDNFGNKARQAALINDLGFKGIRR